MNHRFIFGSLILICFLLYIFALIYSYGTDDFYKLLFFSLVGIFGASVAAFRERKRKRESKENIDG